MTTKTIIAALAAIAVTATTAPAQTLKSVRDRGQLICGVSQGLPGFSIQGEQGRWTGFDADFCRTLAAAVFNDVSKVQFVPLSASERLIALQSKRIDVLSRNTTWTLGREAELGIIFAATTFYDGQGFMVPKARKIESPPDLADKMICAQSGTTTEVNLADYFRNARLTYKVTTFATADEALNAYAAGRCDAITSDSSQLHAQRVTLSAPLDHDILPDIISKEPLGPAIRQDDPQWQTIVKWAHFAMVNAEELGVSRANIDEAMKSQRPDVRRLLGLEGSYGEQLGLTKDWAARIVRLVGNYGEVFERNVGSSSKLAIPRGINSLWDRGGIQYAPPIR